MNSLWKRSDYRNKDTATEGLARFEGRVGFRGQYTLSIRRGRSRAIEKKLTGNTGISIRVGGHSVRYGTFCGACRSARLLLLLRVTQRKTD